MTSNAGVGQVLGQFNALSPAGFAVALHIKFTSSRYLFQAYRKDWLDYYSAHSFVMHDPTVHWGLQNTGHIRWSALNADDDTVMIKAAEHGLKFGFTASVLDQGSRSVASFARSDREFTDPEMASISGMLAQLHTDTLTAQALSPEDHDALKRLSILLTRG